MIYVADPMLTNPQVALAIGRAAGPAVRRNRVRRQLRAHLAELDRAGRLPGGLYLVGLTGAGSGATGRELQSGLAIAAERLSRGES